jgi:hypothetical protein
VSVYLALHTSASPSIEDVADFGRIAIALGADRKQGMAARFKDDHNGLTVVLPIPETFVGPEDRVKAIALREVADWWEDAVRGNTNEKDLDAADRIIGHLRKLADGMYLPFKGETS